MKRLKLLLAVLLVVGVAGLAQLAQAHNVFYNPEDTMGYIGVPVYNNSGSAMGPGTVAVWDIGSSSGDNDAWVTTTSTDNTSIVAGVIWPNNIPIGTAGYMVIWGLAECDIGPFAVSAGTPICTSTTTGQGNGCGNNAAQYGITETVTAGSEQVKCFVNTR